MHILLDDKDRHLLTRYSWQLSERKNTSYLAYRYWHDGKYRGIYLHQMLTKAPAGYHVHHINGNGLDNRRCNLQVVRARAHARATGQHKTAYGKSSKYRGVSWAKRNVAWYAQIRDNTGKKICLGHFPTEEAAARAWDKAARQLGRSANLYNFKD